MTCLLHLLTACLFDPSGVYIKAELDTTLRRGQYELTWCGKDWCSGPRGVLRLGMAAPLTRHLELDYGLVHTSYVNTTQDQGDESAYVSVTWRPFRR